MLAFLHTKVVLATATVNSCRLQSRSLASAVSTLREQLQQELKEIESAGTYKNERVITTKQGTEVSVEGSTKGKLLNFCANNYLGLSSHPEVIKAGKQALDQYGAGLSSVRFICGTQTIHKELERKIAKFHGREDAILYASCFDANAGIFEVLTTPEDAILSDELNHASIIDGIRLAKAQKYRYKHKDMSDLESKLKESLDKGTRRRFIVTDGVFSMDGNVAPLPAIQSLAEKYNAVVFVDECHATGFFGKTGRGTEEYLGCKTPVDIINSTLGKALGGAAGGYTTGPKEIVDLLRQKSRPYLFSNSLPPPVVASSSKVFDLLMTSSDLTQKVASNTKQFRDAMTKAGFTILGENHPICPVFIGDAKLASSMAEKMLAEGIYVIGFSFPVVPKGKARIRVQISAAHQPHEIEKLIHAFTKVGKSLQLIS
ncbi:2-amino-3-ketobutyrate coenzyme A ligase, mitochondrial [Folsomia candida]|uniref:2-amino-3-ketobutyrate coenzyme A ligase, mitochondrial n=1 Tax=Folsomia candida TaxID=158441 RepID=A0A226D8F5_FOLCA|nr:2-amino-3-ketobutyrate coenzyme A ligase, mitochondrial [Folsomia candida]OXA41835.1 2-amino-3-ketobutyrate coenzyme A ligase, mitochondrial [Folsomia candida]